MAEPKSRAGGVDGVVGQTTSPTTQQHAGSPLLAAGGDPPSDPDDHNHDEAAAAEEEAAPGGEDGASTPSPSVVSDSGGVFPENSLSLGRGEDDAVVTFLVPEVDVDAADAETVGEDGGSASSPTHAVTVKFTGKKIRRTKSNLHEGHQDRRRRRLSGPRGGKLARSGTDPPMRKGRSGYQKNEDGTTSAPLIQCAPFVDSHGNIRVGAIQTVFSSPKPAKGLPSGGGILRRAAHVDGVSPEADLGLFGGSPRTVQITSLEVVSPDVFGSPGSPVTLLSAGHDGRILMWRQEQQRSSSPASKKVPSSKKGLPALSPIRVCRVYSDRRKGGTHRKQPYKQVCCVGRRVSGATGFGAHRLVASLSSFDSSVLLWRVSSKSGLPVAKLEDSSLRPSRKASNMYGSICVCGSRFGPQAPDLAAVAGDRNLRLWNLDAEQTKPTILTHLKKVQLASLDAIDSMSSSQLAWCTGATNGVVSLWSRNEKFPVVNVPVETSKVLAVRFVPFLGSVLAGTESGRIYKIETRMNRQMLREGLLSSPCRCMFTFPRLSSGWFRSSRRLPVLEISPCTNQSVAVRAGKKMFLWDLTLSTLKKKPVDTNENDVFALAAPVWREQSQLMLEQERVWRTVADVSDFAAPGGCVADDDVATGTMIVPPKLNCTILRGILQRGQGRTAVEVALKRVSRAEIALAMSELSHLRSLRHPRIVTCFGHRFLENKWIEIILEYCHGGNIMDWLAKTTRSCGRRVPVRVKFRLIQQIVEGMSFLHLKQRIVHRDLKPVCENILIDRRGDVKLCDFGFSRHVGSVVGSIAGTPPYCAPLTFTHEEHGHERDVFSFGITTYEIWRGRRWRPYPAEGLQMKIWSGLRPPLERCRRMPSILARYVSRCWDADPSKVPSFEDLESILSQISLGDEKETDAAEGEPRVEEEEGELLTALLSSGSFGSSRSGSSFPSEGSLEISPPPAAAAGPAVVAVAPTASSEEDEPIRALAAGALTPEKTIRERQLEDEIKKLREELQSLKGKQVAEDNSEVTRRAGGE